MAAKEKCLKRPWCWALIFWSILFSTVSLAKENSSCAAFLQRDPTLASWSDTRLKWAIRYNNFKSWWSGESRDLAVPLVRYLNEAVARKLYAAKDIQNLLQQKASKGNYWPQLAVEESLVAKLEVLTEQERHTQVTASWQAWAKNSLWPSKSKEALLQFIQEKTMFLAQAQLIQKQLPQEISSEDAAAVLSYLNYAFSLPPFKREAAFRDLGHLFSIAEFIAPSSPYLKKFRRYQRLFDRYRSKQEKAYAKKMSATEAKEKAYQDRLSYEELVYGCASLQKNAVHQKAAQRFKLFYVGSSFVVSSSMYFALNWDKPKDGRWFGIWGYDAIMGMIMRYIVAQIRANPQDSLLAKWNKNFIVSAIADVVLSNLFVVFFGKTPQLPVVNNDDLMELVDRHVQTGFKASEIQDKLAGGKPFTPKLNLTSDELSELWPLWKKYFETAVKEGQVVLNDKSLTDDEQMIVLANHFIEKSLAKNAFGEQLASKAWFDTGSSGLDRYIYHRLFFIAFGMPTLALSVWMYHILCVGRDHPMQALIQASVLYALDKVIFDYLYFQFRRHAIHQ